MIKKPKRLLLEHFYNWLPVIIFTILVAGLTIYQVDIMEAAPIASFLQQLDSYPTVGGVVVWLGDEGASPGGMSANWLWPGVAAGLALGGLITINWFRHRRRQE
ncbi:MAG: hypothetical protein JXA42_24625 [Anaerolineales bacterium]|nr:hypothetical protein [Anaerolineales bacterium]